MQAVTFWGSYSKNNFKTEAFMYTVIDRIFIVMYFSWSFSPEGKGQTKLGKTEFY